MSIVNISGIVADGASGMVGERERLVKLIDDAIATQNSHVMKCHCLVHEENLCTEALKMENIMQIIIKIMHFIRAKGLNHHQFQEFLKSVHTGYDIIYFSGVS